MDEELLEHGAFSWMELMTTDVAPAKRFYHQLFGWEMETYPMAGMEYDVVKVAGQAKGGIMRMPPQADEMPPAWGIYVTVDDVDATAKKVAELGGKVLMGPQEIPEVGRFCVIQDPQGAVISAITYLPMEA
jgi:predicted enzyme related to lactoylglutathione lyase